MEKSEVRGFAVGLENPFLEIEFGPLHTNFGSVWSVNFDKFSQRQKCVFCALNGSVYVSRHETCYVVIT